VGFFFKVLKMKQNNQFNFLQMAQTWCYRFGLRERWPKPKISLRAFGFVWKQTDR